MPTYISILRGINVSGQKMIKMDALQSIYESLGFKNVSIYIRSGNIVFQDDEVDPKMLEGKIFQKILEVLAFDVPVLVLNQESFAAIVNENPFVNILQKDINFLHVTFFSSEPDTARIALLNGDFGKDEFAFGKSAVYLFCPEGYGRTKFSNGFFESKLKVSATTRNWKTVTELYRMSIEV